MLDLKTKQQLADSAKTIASSFALVQRGYNTFIPVDWVSLVADPPPAAGERIWLPFSREQKQQLANRKSGILFANDAELRSFDFMIRQLSEPHEEEITQILIKTPQGLMALDEFGALVAHDGSFTPNYVRPMLNENPDDKAEVFAVLLGWLGSEEEVHSLLNHLATSLAPGWSAVKYVLLIGEGRNGKGVLLAMISALFGQENISDITRQMMAERSPTCQELNDKLLNVVMDGEMTYIKDSSMEKTFIAGERGVVRLLYESGTTPVQTNALFIEGLNIEPKNRDKSSALQKRLARFSFPNVYPLNKAFHRRMTSEPMLGAFLSLLIDHYVHQDELAEKLALTQGSIELQLEQVWMGSPVLQFLEHLVNADPGSVVKLAAGSMLVDTFMASFKPWTEAQGMHDRSDGDLMTMLKTSFELGWKTVRVNGKATSKRVVKGLRPETVLALEQMKGMTDDAQEPVDLARDL